MKCLLITLILSLVIVSGCVTTGASPSKDIYFIAISPHTGLPVPISIKKGEFDLSEKERGYRLFNSFEEILNFIKECYSKKENI